MGGESGETGSGVGYFLTEINYFHRLENQFTTTPDMRPPIKLLFCRKIKINK